MFHGASTAAAMTPPKSQHQNTMSTPQQHGSTPRYTPKSASTHRDNRDRDHRPENIAMLLQVLSQENNSAPSTPTSGHRPVPRVSSKHHTRNAQSMSSLPTTPTARRGYESHSGLLPSADLVPQSEPPYRHNATRRYAPETPRARRNSAGAAGEERRKSRESTISAEDNEELARQALKSVAAAASFASMSGSQHLSRSNRSHDHGDGEEEEVYESQASQAASEMLRRDPRESFDVASSVDVSRDGTPIPAAAEKSAKLQARLLGGLHKSGAGGSTPSASEKRKFSGGHGDEPAAKQSHKDLLASPTKKLRTVGGLRDSGRVGLGIQYGRDA
jgi:acetyl-CoA acyltransferase 1